MAEEIDGRRVVQASEILEKIQRGEPVEYDGVIIRGNIDLSKLNLPIQDIEQMETQIKLGLPAKAKLVKSQIKITNTKIDDMLNFSDIIFSQHIIFEKAHFARDTNFSGTSFSEHAAFRDVTFESDADFMGAIFNKRANFLSAKFGNASFKRAIFSRDADFRLVEFRGDAYFQDAEFDGYANFGGASFGRESHFEGATFADAHFGGVLFKERADFMASLFSGDANFLKSTFKRGNNFRGVTFRKGTNLEDYQFSKNIQKYSFLNSDAIKTSIMAATLIFLSSIIIFAVINPYIQLENKKLDLMQKQFVMQAYQTNCSLDLQERSLNLNEAQAKLKGFEIVMNSPVLETTLADLIDSPKEAGNAVAGIAEALINRINLNINLNQPLSNPTTSQKNVSNMSAVLDKSNGSTRSEPPIITAENNSKSISYSGIPQKSSSTINASRSITQNTLINTSESVKKFLNAPLIK